MKENVVFDYNDDAHFRHKLLLTNRQFSNIRKAFADGSRTDIKFSLIQLSKKVQLGWSLGNLFGLLMKSGLPLMVNNLNPLAKSILAPLGFTAVM